LTRKGPYRRRSGWVVRQRLRAVTRVPKNYPLIRAQYRQKWMLEMEFPRQAQTLEVIIADQHRMLFPDAAI